MICPKCNTQNQEGAKFCAKCGAGLAPPAPPSSPPEITAKKGIAKQLLITSVIIISIVILSALGFLFVKNIKKEPVLTTQTSNNVPTNQPTDLSTPANLSSPAEVNKYDLDSNGDAIPDFVEEALGWDPKTNTCAANACGAAYAQTVVKKATNILFILDSSGSMAERLSDGQVKMDAAKAVLKKYIELLPVDINIALMVYGHKGSNSSSDKQISCQTIETLLPFGTNNQDQFKNVVDSFAPTGWTSIAGSLKQAGETVFKGREEDNNFIVLVSDGEETCGGDPSQVASDLNKSNLQVTVDVVGLAVNQNAKNQLSAIASFSQGKYFDAKTSEELREAFKGSNERVRLLKEAGSCLLKNYAQYSTCIYDRWKKAADYVSKLQTDALKAGGAGKAELDSIQKTYNKMLDFYSKKAKENLNRYNQTSKENLDKMIQELNNWQ